MPDPNWWTGTQELFDKRPGTPFSATGARTYKRRFLVGVNTPAVTAEDVCFAPGIPLPYASYISPDGRLQDYFSLVVNITADPKDDDDWQFWIITVDYSTNYRSKDAGSPSQGGGHGGQHNNPEMEPPDINWDNDVTQVAPEKDLDGKFIINKAGLPFSPPPTVPIGNLVLNYSRNELSFDRDRADHYLYSVNSDVFLGYPKGTVMITLYTGRAVYKGPLIYSRTSYRFKILDVLSRAAGKTWQTELLNQGFMRLENAGPQAGHAVNIIRPGGQKLTHPVLLDEDGQEIKQGDLLSNKKKPVWLKFRTLYELPFADLKIIGV